MYLRVSDHLYRGPQPDLPALEKLKLQGLKSVINLRDESVRSRDLALAVGLKYHHIRVVDWNVPTHEQFTEFMEMLADPAWAPALVHCWGGVGRTGIFVSCYRIHHGMDAEEAMSLSDRETPHLIMSELQRDWIRQWTRSQVKRPSE